MKINYNRSELFLVLAYTEHQYYCLSECLNFPIILPILFPSIDQCELNLTSISKTSTTVLIGWNNRNNAVFNIKLSDPNDNRTFRLIESNLMGSNSRMSYNLTNLLPFTSYFVKLNDICMLAIRTAGGKNLLIS